MKLNEDDTLRLGGSSRLYKLNWIPLSRAYDIDNPFVPPFDAMDTVEEDTEGKTFQDENNLSCKSDQAQISSDNMEGLELLYSDENPAFSMQKMSPGSLMPENLCDSFFNEEKVETMEMYHQENEISSIQPCDFDKEHNSHSQQALCPSVVSQTQPETGNMKTPGINSEKRSGLSMWLRRGKPKSVQIETGRHIKNSSARTSKNSRVKSLVHENYYSESVSKDTLIGPDYEEEEIFTPDKENHSPLSLVFGSWKSKDEKSHDPITNTILSSVDQDEEIFTMDKENVTPNACRLMSTKKTKILDVKHPISSHGSSPLNRSGNHNLYQEVERQPHKVLPTQKDSRKKVLPTQKLESFSSKSQASLKKELPILKSRGGRNPFQPLSLKSSCDDSGNSKLSAHDATMRGGSCTNYPKSEEKNSTMEEKNRWTILVETASLLNKNSRKELQLLRGLKGTRLIIPRIVIKEMDCMLKCGSFFRRTGKVSAALQWIEDCMENTKWWIHVQSSAEEGVLIPPTPPSASSPNWFNEDKNAVSIGSIPFSPYGLHEIVTPTTEDHILECALFFKRLNKNEELVLISDDITLKIKAMAEGVICETAEEFRRSLVNPFSERFLYPESSPRGPTWSIVDDVILKEKYYPSPSKKLSKSGGEGVKGLKLILLHNSNFSKNVTAA